MKIEQIIAVGFGIFVVIMIASTGAFSEIINGLTEAIGFYGFVIGVLIIIMMILACLGLGGRRR